MSAKEHIAWNTIDGSRKMRFAAAKNLENAAKFLREDRVKPAVFLCLEIANGFLVDEVDTKAKPERGK